jgi:4-amino-4-deoxy-L-arabinose transferase-like glycosyltransferase
VNAPSLHIEDAAPDRRGRSLLDADPGPSVLVVLLLAILAVRIIALAVSHAELFFDEAQYWAWGQEPAFGYYTKPPLIAWIIGATTSLCGDAPFCVRLPSPLMHFLTSLVIYAIATKLHSSRAGFWAALLYALMPGTSISATLMSTDVPLLLFWAIGLLAIVHHVERPSLAAGVALGAAVGLGLNAKYAMVYLPLCYAVYAVVSPKARATLRHPGTWAALAIALLLSIPASASAQCPSNVTVVSESWSYYCDGAEKHLRHVRHTLDRVFAHRIDQFPALAAGQFLPGLVGLEHRLPRKQVHEPSIKSPGSVCVLVPV